MKLVLVLSVGVLTGCATYQTHVTEARDLLERQSPTESVAMLKTFADQESKDQLVYLLDYATALQVAGDFKESSQVFIKADRMAELQDYTSVTKEAASLLFSEEMVQYKGEDFEKLLINSMAAINYVLMGDLESARVETRRSIEKLNLLRSQQKKEYDDNSFVHYLNGHIWEATGNYDSAFIDFKKAYGMGVDASLVKQDLVRVAEKGRKTTELQKLRKEMDIIPDQKWKEKNMGELVVIYQQGWGPRKAPNPEAPRFPILFREPSRINQLLVKVPGSGEKTSVRVYDLESAAIKTLNDQYGKLVAKRIAGMLAKDAVSKRVAKDNEALGAVLFIAMHASDRADLRQWSTLPKSIQMLRFDLPVGEHQVTMVGLDSAGEAVDEQGQTMTVVIKPKKKTFLGYRTFK